MESAFVPGCTVIKKGQVYEKQLFDQKLEIFKSQKFLYRVKLNYTNLINNKIRYVAPEQLLEVFDKSSPYLAMKKIGKNNPRAEQIKLENDARKEWNDTMDEALELGCDWDGLKEAKKRHIIDEIKISKASGETYRPNRFVEIVRKAVKAIRGLLEFVRDGLLPPGNIEWGIKRDVDRENGYGHRNQNLGYENRNNRGHRR